MTTPVELSTLDPGPYDAHAWCTALDELACDNVTLTVLYRAGKLRYMPIIEFHAQQHVEANNNVFHLPSEMGLPKLTSQQLACLCMAAADSHRLASGKAKVAYARLDLRAGTVVLSCTPVRVEVPEEQHPTADAGDSARALELLLHANTTHHRTTTAAQVDMQRSNNAALESLNKAWKLSTDAIRSAADERVDAAAVSAAATQREKDMDKRDVSTDARSKVADACAGALGAGLTLLFRGFAPAVIAAGDAVAKRVTKWGGDDVLAPHAEAARTEFDANKRVVSTPRWPDHAPPGGPDHAAGCLCDECCAWWPIKDRAGWRAATP